MKYTIMRCPFCSYVWRRKVDRKIVSCPRNKERFDYPGKEVEPEQIEVEFDSYPALSKWLSEANKISAQSGSLKEVLKKTPAK